MTLNVTKWAGMGGYAEGTFTATLYDTEGYHYVDLNDGWFEGFIHN